MFKHKINYKIFFYINMKNINDDENVLVETLKQTAKIMNSLIEKVNRQEEEIEAMKIDLCELKKSRTNRKQTNKTEDVDDWDNYVDEMVDNNCDENKDNNSSETDIKNTNKYGKNSKIMEFVVNKSDKNKITVEPDKNRVRRNEVNENDNKESKIKKMVSGLMKKKNEFEKEINENENKIQIEIEEENAQVEEEEEEEKKVAVTKTRRRGARF
jgi:hypothetical protein